MAGVERVDVAKAAPQLAVSVALGAFLQPLAPILPFLGAGLAKDADCAALPRRPGRAARRCGSGDDEAKIKARSELCPNRARLPAFSRGGETLSEKTPRKRRPCLPVPARSEKSESSP